LSLPNANILTDENIRGNSVKVTYNDIGLPTIVDAFAPGGTTTILVTYSGGTGNVTDMNRYLNGQQVESSSVTYGTSGITLLDNTWI